MAIEREKKFLVKTDIRGLMPDPEDNLFEIIQVGLLAQNRKPHPEGSYERVRRSFVWQSEIPEAIYTRTFKKLIRRGLCEEHEETIDLRQFLQLLSRRRRDQITICKRRHVLTDRPTGLKVEVDIFSLPSAVTLIEVEHEKEQIPLVEAAVRRVLPGVEFEDVTGDLRWTNASIASIYAKQRNPFDLSRFEHDRLASYFQLVEPLCDDIDKSSWGDRDALYKVVASFPRDVLADVVERHARSTERQNACYLAARRLTHLASMSDDWSQVLHILPRTSLHVRAGIAAGYADYMNGHTRNSSPVFKTLANDDDLLIARLACP